LRRRKKVLELPDSLLFVEFVLVLVLDAGAGQIVAEVVNQLLFGERTASPQRIVISA
jgi:hypothetical protein